mmetsp:Transcript_24816/g.49572  ORF Transcript_24816/g.49572 Transcript_24816/m.49572 type:complete len:154 (+) Transcript_24816:27-488(+)
MPDDRSFLRYLWDNFKLEVCPCCMESCDRANIRIKNNHRNAGKTNKPGIVSKAMEKMGLTHKCEHAACMEKEKQGGQRNDCHFTTISGTSACGGCGGTGRTVQLVSSNSLEWNTQGPTRNSTCGGCGGSGTKAFTKKEYCRFCAEHCTLVHPQ